MAVKPKDETGRDWNWGRNNDAAICNQFEENRLSARIADASNPQTGKFGSDGVLISHGAQHQDTLPCFGTLAEVGGDLDISTGNFCIAGWLYLKSGTFAGPVPCDIWGYSRYGVQQPTRYLRGRIGYDYVYYDGVYDAKLSLILDTAILTDGSQISYSLVNGVWLPVTYDLTDEYDNYYVTLHAVIEASEWDDAWHYVAFVRYGNELAVYFEADGVAKKRAYFTYAGALSVCNGTYNKLYIGRGFLPM
jgi:hypothetical protein